jgi:hypothetical protein
MHIIIFQVGDSGDDLPDLNETHVRRHETMDTMDGSAEKYDVHDTYIRNICREVQRTRQFDKIIENLKSRRQEKSYCLHADAWQLLRWLNKNVFDEQIILHPDFIFWARSVREKKVGRYSGLTHFEMLQGEKWR